MVKTVISLSGDEMVIIDNGNDTFTSMLKVDYEAQQVALKDAAK